MVLTAATELGPAQWIPNILSNAGVSGTLVLVWITGLMAVGRMFAGPFVHSLSPIGMLDRERRPERARSLRDEPLDRHDAVRGGDGVRLRRVLLLADDARLRRRELPEDRRAWAWPSWAASAC